MVDYLCGLGHRRIAIITACEDDISIGRLRLNAYRQALLDHGIPYDPDLVFHMTKDDTYSFATGYKITKEILEKKTEFSALYATADTLAIGACRALKEAGLTVRMIFPLPDLTELMRESIIYPVSQRSASRWSSLPQRRRRCCFP